ncbi:MAG: NnrS family protein [Rhodobacteraceae bacterium]|nr:NnrS family protein [Paracoccaceae bacterium]
MIQPSPKHSYDPNPAFDRVIFSYGFRPFFLLSAGYAAFTVLLWAGFWYDFLALPDAIAVGQWHAHEMIFGFATAALAGFLLTAVPEWTEKPHIMGRKLAALVGLWLLGRLGMLFGADVSLVLVIMVNAVFLPVVAFWTLPDIWAERLKRHRSIAFFLPALWLTQMAVYSGWLGAAPDWSYDLALRSLNASLHVFLIGISLVVTRISMALVPLALEEQNDTTSIFRPIPPRRNLAVSTLIIFTLADFFMPQNPIAGWIALAAAAAQLDRMADWHVGRVLLKPYILVIYLSHVWLAIGLAGLGFDALLGWDYFAASRHALGLGAASLAVVAVFLIAGFRHTGRDVLVRWPHILTIILINIATALRVFIPPLLPNYYQHAAIGMASVIWALAFAIFLGAFWPILTKARPDGAPG